MLLSTFPPQSPIATSNFTTTLFPPKSHHHLAVCRAVADTSPAQRPIAAAAAANSSSTSLRHVSTASDGPKSGDTADSEEPMVSSASAVAEAIRNASSSPVEFVQRVERDAARKKALALPSPDFQRLCLEQLHLFRRIVNPDALLSVYVRPAGSYVMDRLELRRITLYPDVNAADIAVLVVNFNIPAGLRAAETAISSQQAEFFPELGAAVFPMVKHPFVVGFLVAELPKISLEKEWHDVEEHTLSAKSFSLSPSIDPQSMDIQTYKDHLADMLKFTPERRLSAINISRSLAMAYVMDQKAMLLQQSSWQNNVRMSNLIEQIRGSLSSIRTLSKMLSLHLRRSEISNDIVEDILVQGDHMSDTIQQLQDAVHLTKANIMHYNSEALKKMHQSTGIYTESINSESANTLVLENLQESNRQSALSSSSKDLEFPVPPLVLAPTHQQGVRRPCDVCDVLEDLVGVVEPLARKQQRAVELCGLSRSSQVAVEEPALRQALSNLIEGALLRTQVGGQVDIVCAEAPAGGALVIVDDDGPDMHYMTQMHSLAPFGMDLCSEEMIEDNMTWNFIAGLSVAREILESYGCVVRVISPRNSDAALGAGGTRVELWLPSVSSSSEGEDSPR